jgi:hypothetical protein
MSTPDWIVLVAGLAAIGLVNWYFFFAERSSRRTVDAAERRP